jgi:hypothetical protein
MAPTRNRKPPRLPPAWIRRATWVHDPASGHPQFLFPGLSFEEEETALDRLHAWADSDANAKTLGNWMALVGPYQALVPCGCPACTAERSAA